MLRSPRSGTLRKKTTVRTQTKDSQNQQEVDEPTRGLTSLPSHRFALLRLLQRQLHLRLDRLKMVPPCAPAGCIRNVRARRGFDTQDRMSSYLPDLFRGDFVFRVERSNFAEAGGWIVLLLTMSLALTPCPYSLPLPSPSGRRVEPSRETPANNPREREYERTSARSVTSVAAAASRPFGPAAAAASAPSLTLLVRMESAPRRFITSRTKSVAWPPI